MRVVWFRIYAVCILLVFCAAVQATPDGLARGRMALEDGFYHKALQSFEGILADAGVSDLVRSEAADLLLRTYAVQMQFDQISGFLSDPERVLFLDETGRAFWQAMLLERQGDFAAALAELGRVADRVEGGAAARVTRLRASIYLQLGQPQEAIALFEQLAAMSSDGQLAAQSRLDWGRALQSMALFEEAISVWEPLMALTNSYPRLAAQAHYLIGETYVGLKSYDKAEAVLAPIAAEVGQGDMLALSAFIARAKSRQLAGDLTGAIALYRWGIEELGEHALRRRLEVELGRSYLESGALEDGKAAILAYASEYVDSPEAPGLLLELGRRLIRAERFDEAISVYQRYLEAFGDRNGVASHGRGLALRGAGRHGEAAMAFEQSYADAQEGPRKEECLFLAGQSRFDHAQYRLALEQFDAYIGRYPEGRFLWQAYYQRANALGALEQLGEAVAALEQLAADAAQSDPLGEQALLRIGTLYLERNFWAEAEAAFDRLLVAFPEGPLYMEGLHGRGMARHHQWKSDAQEDFVRVASEAQDSVLREHAGFMQAVSHFRLGQDQEAIAVCERLLETSPDGVWAAEVRFRLAQFAFNAGQYEVAEKAFLAFEERHPGHDYIPQVLYRAGLAAIHRQQFVQGNEILGRLVQQYPSHELLPYARFYQGEALVQLGRHSTAILMFQEVVRLAPNTEIAYMAWGREGDSHFALASDDATRLEAAARAYQVVVQGGRVRQQDKLQASFKLGRTYEKMGRGAAAMEQYYDGVIVPFHLLLEADASFVGAEERTWYSRTVRSASEILTRQQDWRSLVRILDRAAGTDADIAVEAGRRARSIRAEYWWLFY